MNACLNSAYLLHKTMKVCYTNHNADFLSVGKENPKNSSAKYIENKQQNYLQCKIYTHVDFITTA